MTMKWSHSVFAIIVIMSAIGTLFMFLVMIDMILHPPFGSF